MLFGVTPPIHFPTNLSAIQQYGIQRSMQMPHPFLGKLKYRYIHTHIHTHNTLPKKKELTSSFKKRSKTACPPLARWKVKYISHNLALYAVPWWPTCLHHTITKLSIFHTWQKRLQLCTCHSTHPWKQKCKSKSLLCDYFCSSVCFTPIPFQTFAFHIGFVCLFVFKYAFRG